MPTAGGTRIQIGTFAAVGRDSPVESDSTGVMSCRCLSGRRTSLPAAGDSGRASRPVCVRMLSRVRASLRGKVEKSTHGGQAPRAVETRPTSRRPKKASGVCFVSAERFGW
jgi:hypothetical protein